MPQIFISLGSNIEPRLKTIENTINTIEETFITTINRSSYFESKPYLGFPQAYFINTCIHFETTLDIFKILEEMQKIEKLYGRKHCNKRWMPRTIDIDLLLFGNTILESKNLTIPHYDIHNRDFFLVPLLEIKPNLTNPKTKRLFIDELNSIPSSKKTITSRLND